METKQIDLNEETKNFHRDFDKPVTWVCILRKKDSDEKSALPFATFANLDTMLIFRMMCNDQNIQTENILFLKDESGELVGANAENDQVQMILFNKSDEIKTEE